MFGQKKRTIQVLTSDVEFWKARSSENLEAQQKAQTAHARTKSELAIVQETYSSRMKELDELYCQVGDLEARNESLKYELAEARLQNENLREEAAESSRMLELYKALVASFRIVIKLPAKKTRG